MFLAADKTGRQSGPSKTSAFLARCVTPASGNPWGFPAREAISAHAVPRSLFPGTHFLLGVVYLLASRSPVYPFPRIKTICRER